MTRFDLSPVRSQFPALLRVDAGRPAVYFDGPGGTQVPQGVVDAMSRYLIQANANHGGALRSNSIRTRSASGLVSGDCVLME